MANYKNEPKRRGAMRRRMLQAAIVIGTLVFIYLIYISFFPYLAAPTWDVTVLDSGGKAVADLPVSEIWQNYSCETENHKSILKTDDLGQVHFPPVHSRHTPKCIHETASELLAGVHASLGSHVYIDVPGLICVTDDKGYCVDWAGRPDHMISRVRLETRK
jgi:hypothetical protein